MCHNEKQILEVKSRKVNGVCGVEDIVCIQLKSLTAVKYLPFNSRSAFGGILHQ